MVDRSHQIDSGPLSTLKAVLIIERRGPISDILCDLLRDAGFVAIAAPDLARAFHIAGILEISLILADLDMFGQMPEWVSYQLSSNLYLLDVQLFIYYTAHPELASSSVLLARSPVDFARVVRQAKRLLKSSVPNLGELLLAAGYLSEEEFRTLINIQTELERIGKPMELSRLIVRLGLVNREQINEVLFRQIETTQSTMRGAPRNQTLSEELLNRHLGEQNE